MSGMAQNGPDGAGAPNQTEPEEQLPRLRTAKAPNAFRTISEVADELHIPQHVLRFWEGKFTQIKPLKRGGGRRYYRPEDIGLLRQVSDLLHIQGYTIRGVQRLLKEGGGKLSDNIPPPSAAEREAASEELSETEGSPEQASFLGGKQPTEAAVPLPTHDPMLRSLLSHTLRELEALRALLP